MKKNRGMLIAFITPALLLFCVIFIYPIIRTGIMSLYKVENVTSSMDQWEFVGFSNFTTLLNTSLFQTAMWNLFRIWLVGGFVVLSLGLLFAVILNSGIRGKKFFRAVIYMPNIISAVALATMWIQFVFNTRFGLLTVTFEALSNIPIPFLADWFLDLSKINWTDTTYKFWSLLFAYSFGMVGYHMLIFSSGIEKIPVEFFEASTIDGANRRQQFTRITFPLLRGVIRTNITMWSITSVGFFVWSQLFSMVTADTQTITPMVYMYQQVFGAGNVVTERNAGIGAAVGVVLCICVVSIFVITNRVIRDDDLEF